MNHDASRPAERLVSFSFDDGLEAGARIAAEILGEFGLPATFYVVTGWVGCSAASGDQHNRGRSHGDWDFWRSLQSQGHEIGSHSRTHFNMRGKRALISPWRVFSEVALSRRDLDRELGPSARSISMPWNASSALSRIAAKRHFDACRLGDSELRHNLAGHLDRYALHSWTPPKNAERDLLSRALRDIPPGGWLIFQYHSFEDEGWEPLSRQQFRELCELVANERSLRVVTVGQGADRLLQPN